MIVFSSKTLMNHVLRKTLLLSALCIVLPASAMAVQWEPLARTGRHDVAIDTGSVRLTNLSRLTAWLRFTPIDEIQRRQAAAEYGQKAYRVHLEFYEIDCSEQSAVLGIVDILGSGNKRLFRTKGNSVPEAIIPGSVLDLAFQKICPALEEEVFSNEDDNETPDSGTTPEIIEQRQISEESRQSIAEAVQKTGAEPGNLEAWRELGNAYFDADMPSQAVAAYARALAIKPDDTNILNDQGAMYRQIGDFPRALANFEKARQIDPQNLESLYNSGYVLAFDLNQIDKAIVLWRRYLAQDRTSETSRQVQSFIERYGSANDNNARK
jgi:tetratricopeptide (TPR) repeat protein